MPKVSAAFFSWETCQQYLNPELVKNVYVRIPRKSHSEFKVHSVPFLILLDLLAFFFQRRFLMQLYESK